MIAHRQYESKSVIQPISLNLTKNNIFSPIVAMNANLRASTELYMSYFFAMVPPTSPENTSIRPYIKPFAKNELRILYWYWPSTNGAFSDPSDFSYFFRFWIKNMFRNHMPSNEIFNK